MEVLPNLQAFEKVRKAWREEAERDPTDEEWAAAVQVDVHTLRRQLCLGKAARNKLIQVTKGACQYSSPSV